MRTKLNITIIATLSLLWLALAQGACLGATTSQILQFGITWTFNREYEYGTFANGDYWIVGPVTITGIYPSSFVGDSVRTQDGDSWVVETGRTVNGAMINIDSTIKQIGYDSSVTSYTYNENLNVARKNGAPISAANWLELPANTSLVSTISLDHDHSEYGAFQGYVLKSAAILTILEEPAPSGSFRPSYCGGDKTIKFNENQLNYSLLKTLNKYDYCDSDDLKMDSWEDERDSSAERVVHRPWIDHLGGGTGDVIAPIENVHRYPGYRNYQLQEIAMYLNVDWTGSPDFESNEQYKQNLLVSTVQLGIDLYGVYQAGAKDQWVASAGHGVSRKWPILFAGVMLEGDGAHADADAMANIGFNDDDDPHFSEDDQTFYVSQAILDAQNATYEDSYAGERSWADRGSLPYPPGSGGLCEFAAGGAISPCLNVCGPDSRDSFDIPHTQKDMDNQLPEYAIWGTEDLIYRCNRAWNTYYRRHQVSAGWPGIALSLHIMGLKDEWNHDAFFDYVDRYVAIEKEIKANIVAGGGLSTFAGYIWDPLEGVIIPVEHNISGTPATDVHGNPVHEVFKRHYVCSSAFVEKMWDEYRADYGPVWPNTFLYGDVSGDGQISAYDAALAAMHAVGLITLSAEQITKADVTGNGTVSATDAAWIARRAVDGTIVFPVEEP